MRAEKKATKPQPTEESKRKLSKLVAELERRLHEEEKKNTKMINKMKQSEADQDKYKQKYSILKTQIMTQEADKNRMYKQTSAPIEEPLAPISQ